MVVMNIIMQVDLCWFKQSMTIMSSTCLLFPLRMCMLSDLSLGGKSPAWVSIILLSEVVTLVGCCKSCL